MMNFDEQDILDDTDILRAGEQPEDRQLENNSTALRPLTFAEYTGQKKHIDNLKIYVKAARDRGDSLDHCLFYGTPGLGKTTLANIIENELGVNIKTTNGPTIERAGDLAALLTNLQFRDVLL